MHQHVLGLPDPERPVGRLILHRRIPPAVEMDDMVSGREVEPAPAGPDRDHEHRWAFRSGERGDELGRGRTHVVADHDGPLVAAMLGIVLPVMVVRQPSFFSVARRCSSKAELPRFAGGSSARHRKLERQPALRMLAPLF